VREIDPSLSHPHSRRCFATGSVDGGVVVWDCRTLEPLFVMNEKEKFYDQEYKLYLNR
jgi:hypothetical protein